MASKFTTGDDTVEFDQSIGFGSLDGLAGYDNVKLADGGNFVFLKDIEVLKGGTGGDSVTLQGMSDPGAGVYLDLGAGIDNVAIRGVMGLVGIRNAENLDGSSGDDSVVLSYDTTDPGKVTLAGHSGVDALTILDLSGAGLTREVAVSGFEKITTNADVHIMVGAESNGMYIEGRENRQVVADLSGLTDGAVNRLTAISVSGVVGSDARDVVQVGFGYKAGPFASHVDLGAGNDRVEMLDSPSAGTLRVTNVEAVLGSKAGDLLVVEGQTPFRMSIDLAGGSDALKVASLADENRELLVSNVETIVGGDGNETITVRTAAKGLVADGGTGFDVLILSNSNNSVTVSGFEVVAGGSGSDRITVQGTQGLQVMGGAGVDVIVGGVGDDFIMGGIGKDTMTGGAGADIFFFNSIADSDLNTRDIVTDFQAGVDRLVFQGVERNPGSGTGPQQFDFLGSVQSYTGKEFQATGHAQAVFLDTTDQLFLDVDGNGSMDMRMTLQGVDGSQLSAADFSWIMPVA